MATANPFALRSLAGYGVPKYLSLAWIENATDNHTCLGKQRRHIGQAQEMFIRHRDWVVSWERFNLTEREKLAY